MGGAVSAQRAVIVGAGVIGLMSAYYLRREGFEVTVLERGPKDRNGASYGNAGLVVPSHFVPLAAPGIVMQGIKWMGDPKSPFYIKPRLDPSLISWGWRFWRASSAEQVRRNAPVLLELNLRSRDLYVQLNEELGHGFHFEQLGMNVLANTQRGLEGETKVAEMATELGLSVTVLDADEVQAREPGIDLNVVGAVHYADDAHLDPGALMLVLGEQLERDGVDLRFETEVTAFEEGGGRVTAVLSRTSAGEVVSYPADHVVIAAGSWSPKLASSVGLSLSVQPGKGYSLTLEEPSQRLSAPAILSEARAAVTRMGERLRVGGTMELAGFDESANETRVQGIIESVRRYFPSLSESELNAPPRWHGFRPTSPDGLPYLGASPKHENLTVATGHVMMGLSLAPISGKVISQLATGQVPEVNIVPLAVNRHGSV